MKAPRKGGEWILSTKEKICGFLESGLSRLAPDERKQFADLCTRFSGVHDTASFTSSLRTFRETGSQNRISLIQRRNGRLLRLEEVVDGRYAHSHETDIKEEQMTLKPRIPETSEEYKIEITAVQYEKMSKRASV